MTNDIELSETARADFHRALTKSADLLLAEPKAAHVLRDFLDGRAVLIVTRDGMAVRAVLPDWVADEQPQNEPDNPVTPAADNSGDVPGMYM